MKYYYRKEKNLIHRVDKKKGVSDFMFIGEDQWYQSVIDFNELKLPKSQYKRITKKTAQKLLGKVDA